jgi:predicted nuclease of predicted toxin-antitoxin system
VKFLVDECLSPKLATLARALGFPESTHVTWLGMRSREDGTILRRAIDDGFILVTNNTADFIALYERAEIHAGLVCLNGPPNQMSLKSKQRSSVWLSPGSAGTSPSMRCSTFPLMRAASFMSRDIPYRLIELLSSSGRAF